MNQGYIKSYDFIVWRKIDFFCFPFDRRIAKEAARKLKVFAYFISWKWKEKQPGNIGNRFLNTDSSLTSNLEHLGIVISAIRNPKSADNVINLYVFFVVLSENVTDFVFVKDPQLAVVFIFHKIPRFCLTHTIHLTNRFIKFLHFDQFEMTAHACFNLQFSFSRWRTKILIWKLQRILSVFVCR